MNVSISTIESPSQPAPAGADTGTTAGESVLRPQIEKLVEVIRPALHADGGDMILHDVDDATGVVTVELTGACVGCPASSQTMQAGIERIMKDRVDGVTAVINLSDAPIVE